MLLLLTATAIGAYAQGNGIAGINEATKMVTSYFDPGTKLIYAVVTMFAMAHALLIYLWLSGGFPPPAAGHPCVVFSGIDY